MCNMKTLFASAVLAAAGAASLQGCAVPPLDPFGRPYNGEDAVPPQPLECDSAQVDTQPELVRGNRPLYPADEDRHHATSEVTIRFEIDAAGQVRLISVENAKSKYFASHAVIAMRDWKIVPARKDGVAVPVQCSIMFDYGRSTTEGAPASSGR
jgi:TonB family protein